MADDRFNNLPSDGVITQEFVTSLVSQAREIDVTTFSSGFGASAVERSLVANKEKVNSFIIGKQPENNKERQALASFNQQLGDRKARFYTPQGGEDYAHTKLYRFKMEGDRTLIVQTTASTTDSSFDNQKNVYQLFDSSSNRGMVNALSTVVDYQKDPSKGRPQSSEQVIISGGEYAPTAGQISSLIETPVDGQTRVGDSQPLAGESIISIGANSSSPELLRAHIAAAAKGAEVTFVFNPNSEKLMEGKEVKKGQDPSKTERFVLQARQLIADELENYGPEVKARVHVKQSRDERYLHANVISKQKGGSYVQLEGSMRYNIEFTRNKRVFDIGVVTRGTGKTRIRQELENIRDAAEELALPRGAGMYDKYVQGFRNNPQFLQQYVPTYANNKVQYMLNSEYGSETMRYLYENLVRAEDSGNQANADYWRKSMQAYQESPGLAENIYTALKLAYEQRLPSRDEIPAAIRRFDAGSRSHSLGESAFGRFLMGGPQVANRGFLSSWLLNSARRVDAWRSQGRSQRSNTFNWLAETAIETSSFVANTLLFSGFGVFVLQTSATLMDLGAKSQGKFIGPTARFLSRTSRALSGAALETFKANVPHYFNNLHDFLDDIIRGEEITDPNTKAKRRIYGFKNPAADILDDKDTYGQAVKRVFERLMKIYDSKPGLRFFSDKGPAGAISEFARAAFNVPRDAYNYWRTRGSADSKPTLQSVESFKQGAATLFGRVEGAKVGPVGGIVAGLLIGATLLDMASGSLFNSRRPWIWDQVLTSRAINKELKKQGINESFYLHYSSATGISAGILNAANYAYKFLAGEGNDLTLELAGPASEGQMAVAVSAARVRAYADALQKNKTITDEAKAQLRKLGFSGREFTYDNLMNFSNKLLARASLSPGAELQSFIGKGLKSFSIQIPLGVPQLGAMTLGVSELNREWSFGLTVQGPVQATVGFTMKLLRLSWPSKADDQLRPEKPSWWPEFSLQNTLLERTFFTMAALGGAAALFSGSSALIKRVTKGGNFVSTIFSQAASALNTAAVYAMRYSLALPELVALASKGFRSMLMQQTAESTIGHGENKAEILERISANNKDARGELRQRVEKHVKEGGKKPLLGWYFLNRDRFMHDSLVQLRETLGSDTFRGRQLPGGMKVAGALGLVAAGLTAAVATMGLLFGFNKDNVFDRIVGDYVGDRAMHSARAFKADPVLMAQSGQKQPTPQKHGFGSMLANFISNTLFGTQETLVQVGPFALYGSPASFVRGTGFLGYNVDSAESMDYYARVKDKDLQVIARGYVQLSRIVPFDLSVSQGTTGIKQNQTAEAAIRNHLNFLRNDPRRVQMAAPLRARSRYLNYYSGVETLTPASQMVIAQRKNMGDWLIYQDELSLANYLGYGYQRQEVDYADTEMRYLKGSLVAPGLSKLFSRYFNSLIRQSIQSATVPEVDFDYDENYRPSALRNRPGLNLDNPMSSWFNLLAAGTLAAIGGGAYIYARSMEASLVNIALTNLLVNSEDNYARLKHWGINSLDDFSASVKSARFYVTNYGRHFYTFGRDAARMSDSAHVRELIQHGVISVEKVGGQVKGVSAIFHNLSTIQEANRLGQTGNLDNLKSELLTSVESEIKRIKTVLEKFDSDTALEQLKGQYGKTLEAAHGHLEKLHGYLSGLEAKQMTVDEFMKSKLIGLGRIELLSGLGYQQISVWSILKNNFKDLARSEWKRFKSQMNTFFEIDTANISTATRVKGAASKAVVATAAKLREAGQNIAFWVLGEGPDANANRDPQAVGSPETEAAPAPSPSEPLEPGAGRSLLSKMSAGLMKFTGLLMGSFAYLAWNLLPMLRSFSPFRSNELAGEKELAENTRRVAAKASIIDVKENLSSAASISVLAFGASRLIGPTSALGMSAYNKAAERYNNTWLGRRAQATILDQDKVITPTREARGKFSTQGLIAAGAFAVAGAAVYGFASGGDAKTALYGAKHWGAVGLNLVGLAAVGAALLAVATAAATGGAAAAGVTVIGFGLLYAGGLLLDKLGHGLADTSLGKRVLRFFDSFDPDPDTLRKANENFLIHGVNTALSGAYQGFRSFLSYVPRKLLKWVKTYRMETPQQERGKLSELWYGMMEWVGLSLSVTPYSGTDQLEGSEDQFESTTHPSNAYLWNYPATFRLPPGSAFGAASKMPFWLGPLSEGLQLWAQNTRDRQKKDGSAENDLTTDWFSADVLSPGVRRDFYASKLTSDYSATAGNLSVLTATSIRVLQERAFYAIPIMKQMQGDENNRLFFSGAGLENPAPSYPRDKVPQQKSKGWLNWLKGFFGEAAEAATLSDSRAGRIHLLRPQKGSGHKVPEARGYYTPKTTAIQPSGVPFDSGFFVTSQYGVKRGDRTHMGIDLVPKREGDTAIRAAAGGRVKHIGYQDSGYGNWIEITNSRGISQRYAHMATRPSLRVGDTVIKGQTIGQMGSTGHSSGPHVHFEVLVNQRKINPNEFLNLAADATAAVAKRVKQRGGRVNSQGKLGHPPPHVRVTVDKKNDHPVHQPGIPKRRKADAVRAVKDPNSNKVSLELHHHDDYAWGIMYDPYQTGTDMLAIDPYAAC